MKKLILLLILPLSHCLGQASVVSHTLGQCLAANTAFTTGSACGGSSNVGAAINTATASLLVACPMVFGNGVAGSVSDNKSNTWHMLTQTVVSAQFSVQLWYAIPTSPSQIGAGHTFTISAGGGGTFNSMGVVALKGNQVSTTYVTSSVMGGAVGSNITITPSAAADALVSCLSDDNANAKTINGGFSVIDSTTTTGNGETGGTAFQTPGATTAITFTWSDASSSGAQTVADFTVGAAPSSSGSIHHKASAGN